MAAATLPLLAAGGGLIGLLLSLLGAGGSILLLPLLVGVAALSTREAVPLSLLVVTLLALGNLGPVLRRGEIALRPALLLGVPALLGSWIGGRWVKAGLVSEPLQLALFVVAALIAAVLLLRRGGSALRPRPLPSGLPAVAALGLVVQGLLVGLLTGIAGVGGGFAIVPALVLLAGLPMPRASGTSLLLIGLNSLVALVALGHWPAGHLVLLAPLLLGGFFGALLGRRLAPHLGEQHLRQGFAALLLATSMVTGVEAIRRQGGVAALLSSSSRSTVLCSPSHHPSQPVPADPQSRGR